MLIKAGIGAVMTAAVVGTTLQIAMPPRPKVLYNPSSSAPIGWYQVTDNFSPKTHDLLARDRLGREMPRKFMGCLTLGAGELWIASPDVQTGFDSR